jgi:hypothetical protein
MVLGFPLKTASKWLLPGIAINEQQLLAGRRALGGI